MEGGAEGVGEPLGQGAQEPWYSMRIQVGHTMAPDGLISVARPHLEDTPPVVYMHNMLQDS